MKKSNRKDWFKLWARDIVTSLDWQKMSLQERGAYCSLLFQSWIEWPECSLPADEATLRVICNASGVRNFDVVLRRVLRKFEKENGRIYNKKLREQRDELVSALEVKHASAAKAGKASALSKANRSVNQMVDHNGGHKEVEVEREGEEESKNRPSDVFSEEEQMKLSRVVKILVPVWKEVKGANATI